MSVRWHAIQASTCMFVQEPLNEPQEPQEPEPDAFASSSSSASGSASSGADAGSSSTSEDSLSSGEDTTTTSSGNSAVPVPPQFCALVCRLWKADKPFNPCRQGPDRRQPLPPDLPEHAVTELLSVRVNAAEMQEPVIVVSEQVSAQLVATKVAGQGAGATRYFMRQNRASRR